MKTQAGVIGFTMKLHMIIGASMLLAGPLVAAETPWQEVFPEVSMRLVADNTLTESGSTWIGLEIDMPPDIKTYWRVPGESGIPPRFDFSSSSGIAGYDIAWPMPLRETDKGYVDHVYYGHTVLPLELAVEESRVDLDVEILLGVCSDICIPVMVRFETMLDFARPHQGAALRIRQALAQAPLPEQDSSPIFGAAHFDAQARHVSVDIEDASALPQSVLADIEGTMALFAPPRHDAESGALMFDLLGSKSLTLEPGMVLNLTYQTPLGPVEAVRPLQ